MTYFFSKEISKKPKTKNFTLQNYFATINIPPKVINKII